MKKLITIMASMATCLLFGDGFTNSGASFEYAGDTLDLSKDDQGTTSGSRYWSSATSDNAIYVLTNYPVAEVGSDLTKTPTNVVSRPDMFANVDNERYLAIDTDTRLYRSAESIQNTDFTPVPINNGIYLDTLVKFTPAEDETGLVLEGTDKIAIAYVEHEDLETPANSYTNFVICAGYLGSPLSVTNYFAAVPANFDKDAWHRLTVRSFASIDAAGDVGFVVYLDEVPLQYDTAVDAGPEFAATGAAAAFYTSEVHALFPSAVQSGEYKSSIAAVAFTGNGSVDDVTFTTDTPNFIKAGEAVRTEITLGTGVAAVTVTVDEETITPEDATATPLVFNLPAGTTNFVLGVTADTVNGYEFDEATGIELVNATYNAATDTVLFDAGTSPALTVKGKRNNVTYIDGEDQQQSSSSLATALAAAKAGSTITLAYSVDVADIEGSAFETYEITSGKNLVLDLNGKTITWNDDQGEEALFTVRSGASFRVIDSSVANTGAIVYTGVYAVFYNKGDCYIGATTGDKGPTIQGKLAANKAEAQIVRGKFDKATNGASAFTWTDYIEEGSELVESLGDYWVVEPQSTPEPVIPTYVLTIPEVTGASAEVTSNDVVVADLTAIPSNTAVVVTWTLSEGYKLTDGSLTENITMDSNKEAAAPTVAKIQYVTLTIESVANCTIVVSNATAEVATGAKFDVDDNVQLTVYRTPAEGYVLDGYAATENITMDQDRTVTAAVKSSGGSYPSYIPDDPAVKAKYDSWATYAGVTPAAAAELEDAFLLNCLPAEVEAATAAFKFTSISYDTTQKKWVATTTTGYNERPYNGTVTVTGYSDVGCTDPNEAGPFFKATLD